MRILLHLIVSMGQILSLLVLVPFGIFKRLTRSKKVRVGFGPEPINPNHSIALKSVGYESSSFVTNLYYTNSNFDKILIRKTNFGKLLDQMFCRSTFYALNNFNVLVFYFHGGPFGFHSKFLWRAESYLYKSSGIKTILLPYGSDVQDLRLNSNLLYKNALSLDYPDTWKNQKNVALKVEYWQHHGDYVISGCDWVCYMTHWDQLCLSHFVVDVANIPKRVAAKGVNNDSLKILHAPNHREIKGTRFIEQAIEELKSEGLKIDLILLEGVSNERVLDAIQECDLVVEQLIIGWYALFAIEAMAAGKPVISNVNSDFLSLYESIGLLEPNEIPIIHADANSIKSVIQKVYNNREILEESSKRSRSFVLKHHSYEAIGELFAGAITKVLK